MTKQSKAKTSVPEAAPARDATRGRILEQASKHFFAHGFRGVSMDDLATELGMSKKTLYTRFDTKQQLLEAIIDEQFRKVNEDCERILAASGSDFSETLQDFLTCTQRNTAEIQPPFIKDVRQEAPEIFQRIERHRRGVIERHFGELMRRGRAAGFIRKDIPAALIIEILLAALEAIVNPVRLEEFDLTTKSGCSLIARVVLEGAIAPNARHRSTSRKETK